MSLSSPSAAPQAVNPPAVPADEVLAGLARQALQIEAQALLDLRTRLEGGGAPAAAFARAVALVLACHGRLVVMGMGKSGHVGRKIAATLASTGTPAMFVHPAEAHHGDLGMVTPGDVVLAISNSGESEELTGLLPVLKRQGVPLIAMTGKAESALARHADVVLDSAVAVEACPLNLAPTASTTAQMALGDALAVALLDARGFREEDFARSHPGGSLGRRLLMHVHDLMREMSAKGLGAAAIVDAEGRVLGIFTDGDLRRKIETGTDLRATTAAQVMTPAPRTIGDELLAAEAVAVMEERRITTLLVVDADGRLVGALNTNDLMRAKVI